MVLEAVVTAVVGLDDAVAAGVGYLARQDVLVAVDTCIDHHQPW